MLLLESLCRCYCQPFVSFYCLMAGGEILNIHVHLKKYVGKKALQLHPQYMPSLLLSCGYRRTKFFKAAN